MGEHTAGVEGVTENPPPIRGTMVSQAAKAAELREIAKSADGQTPDLKGTLVDQASQGSGEIDMHSLSVGQIITQRDSGDQWRINDITTIPGRGERAHLTKVGDEHARLTKEPTVLLAQLNEEGSAWSRS